MNQNPTPQELRTAKETSSLPEHFHRIRFQTFDAEYRRLTAGTASPLDMQGTEHTSDNIINVVLQEMLAWCPLPVDSYKSQT